MCLSQKSSFPFFFSVFFSEFFSDLENLSNKSNFFEISLKIKTFFLKQQFHLGSLPEEDDGDGGGGDYDYSATF